MPSTPEDAVKRRAAGDTVGRGGKGRPVRGDRRPTARLIGAAGRGSGSVSAFVFSVTDSLTRIRRGVIALWLSQWLDR